MTDLNDHPAASKVLDSIGLSAGDSVLILTDTVADMRAIDALAGCISINGGKVAIDSSLPARHSEEFPEEIIGKIRAADVIILAASISWYHVGTRRVAKYEWGKKVVECYGLVRDMLIDGAFMADTRETGLMGNKIVQAVQIPAEVRVTSRSGSDLTFRVTGISVEDGDYRGSGSGGNLPAGEVSCTIEPGSAEGVIVFDVSCDKVDRGSAVRLEVEGGLIKRVTGNGAEELIDDLAEFPTLANVIELGLGINKDAISGRSVLEDEKVLGFVHIGFGNSTYFGGTITGPHYDGVMSQATVTFDEKVIIDNGTNRTFDGL